MRILVWVESLLRPAALLAVLLGPVHALAGVHIEQFGYFKFVGPGVGTTFIDTFDDGGPLINPAGAFEWQVRVGTIRDEDEDSGLKLKPWSRGAELSIGPYLTRSQVLELQTPLTGPEAIDNAPSSFVVFAVYEIDSYTRDRFSAGVGLTDVFRGGGTRAIAATIERDGDSYYGKFSNALTGDIWDRRLLDLTGAKYAEFFIQREQFTSDSVISGYGLRDASFNLIGPVTYFNGLALAFSDVVLSPVVFAAVPVPEPATWALSIVGLTLIGCRVYGRAHAQQRGRREA